jgi:hypothetical protein
VGNREDRISLCSPGLPPTHYEAQAWLNLMTILPQSPKFWDYRCTTRPGSVKLFGSHLYTFYISSSNEWRI